MTNDRLNKVREKVARKTTDDVARETVQYEIDQRKANKEPELSQEEKAKLFRDRMNAMHGWNPEERD